MPSLKLFLKAIPIGNKNISFYHLMTLRLHYTLSYAYITRLKERIMKKALIFISLLCLFGIQLAQAQVKFGLRGGISTMDIEAQQLLITDANGLDEFTLAVRDAKFGIHAGFFAKIPIGPIFLQPEVVFNSNKVTFTQDNTEGVLSEKYQYLDIPLIAGIKLGPLKPQIGLVGHVFIDSMSDLQIEDYQQEFRDLTVGWQGGLGIEVKKVLIDIKYEGNFSRFGNHITVGDNEYAFDDRPSRIILSIGYAF